MNQGHIAEVMCIETEAYAFPWTEDIFRDCLRVGYSCWVAECWRGLCGYGLLAIAAGECHVLNVCIKPDLQGRGIGGRFMGHLMAVAMGRGAEKIFLEARVGNRAARRLYRDLGFRRIGRRKGYYPAEQGREDAVVMAKTLL